MCYLENVIIDLFIHLFIYLFIYLFYLFILLQFPYQFSVNVIEAVVHVLTSREDKEDREYIPHTHPIPWVILLE